MNELPLHGLKSILNLVSKMIIITSLGILSEINVIGSLLLFVQVLATFEEALDYFFVLNPRCYRDQLIHLSGLSP